MENHVQDRGGQYQYNFRAESLDPLRTMQPIDKPTKFHISTQLECSAKDLASTLRDGEPIFRGNHKRVEEMPVNVKLTESVPWNSGVVLPKKVYDSNHNKLTATATVKCQNNRSKYLDESKYVSPMNSTKKLQDTVRDRKLEGTFEWKKLINRDRALDEPVDRRLLKNRCPTEKPQSTTSNQHSGVWGMNKAEGR